MTPRNLFLAAFLAFGAGAAFVPTLAFVALVAVVGFMSVLALENQDQRFASQVNERLAKIESKAELTHPLTPRVEALEAKIHDPANGLAEQLRQVRNVTNFKGSR